MYLKPKLVFAVSVGFAIGLTTWLLSGEASPVHDYNLFHPGPGNVLGYLNFPAVIVAFLASGNVHQPSEVIFYVATFLQWFAISYAFSFLIWRRSSGAAQPGAPADGSRAARSPRR